MSAQKIKNKNELHVPPHDLEAEKSVLGALLIDKDSIVKVVEFLKPLIIFINLLMKEYMKLF